MFRKKKNLSLPEYKCWVKLKWPLLPNKYCCKKVGFIAHKLQ